MRTWRRRRPNLADRFEIGFDMAVTMTVAGKVGDREIRNFRLDNGELKADVWDFGATLISLQVPDGQGAWVDVLLHHPSLDGYTDPLDRAGYLGSTIGRYANRIGGSRFELDGQVVELAANQDEHQLHGGPDGFDQRWWTPDLDIDVDGELDADSVLFTLVSPDGDQGYPGRLTAQVRYRLTGSTLEISYTATTDAPTVVNLTNHAYWNLVGGGSVAQHTLQVFADDYLPLDADSIPTGVIAPAEGTRFDLRTPTQLDQVLDAGGIDRCFLAAPFTADAETEVRDVAILRHPPTGRSMTVATDQPTVQVYTANHLPEPHTAVCLETQLPPNAPNAPQFGPSVLRPGETYRHRTRHTFVTEP